MADERTNELDEMMAGRGNAGETDAAADTPKTTNAGADAANAVNASADAAETACAADTAGSGTGDASSAENWRMDRDAAALARQRLQAAGEGECTEQTGTAESAEAITALPEPEKNLSRKERRQKEKEDKERQKREEKEEKERQKREAQEEKERRKREEQEARERAKREAQEEKERQKRLAEEERQRKQYEKKAAKAIVRQERRQEWKSLWHTTEFAMLITFIVLAIDQAGLYGFLFVWLFVAVMIASIALLLLGIVRAIRKKRCGIIFFVAVVGILVCTAWFIFLVSSQGLGLGPVPD